MQESRRLDETQLLTAIDRGTLPDGSDINWDDDNDLRMILNNLGDLDEGAIDKLLAKLEMEPTAAAAGTADCAVYAKPAVRPGNPIERSWWKYPSDFGSIAIYGSLVAAVLAVAISTALSLYQKAQKPLLETQVQTQQGNTVPPSLENMWMSKQAIESGSGASTGDQAKSYSSQNSFALKKGPPGYYYAPVIVQGDGEGTVRGYELRSCALEKRQPYICYFNQ